LPRAPEHAGRYGYRAYLIESCAGLGPYRSSAGVDWSKACVASDPFDHRFQEQKMTELLTKAFQEASKLPHEIQDELARRLLDDLVGESQSAKLDGPQALVSGEVL
jgi:hypothetical protein